MYKLSYLQKQMLIMLRDNSLRKVELVAVYTNCNGYNALRKLEDNGLVQNINGFFKLTDLGINKVKEIDSINKFKEKKKDRYSLENIKADWARTFGKGESK